ncbi:hypothetical protein BHE74_00014633, partial [Ensete ventricosum]
MWYAMYQSGEEVRRREDEAERGLGLFKAPYWAKEKKKREKKGTKIPRACRHFLVPLRGPSPTSDSFSLRGEKERGD